MTESHTQDRRGRDLPWLQVVRFHREIATRAEKSFFSLVAQDSSSERWTSLKVFDPQDLAGPWVLGTDDLRSDAFRLAALQGRHESIYLGGPGYVGWEKPMGSNSWVQQWRPLLYREVQLQVEGSRLLLVPAQGAWNLSPLFFELVERLEVGSTDSLEDFAQTLIESASATVDQGGSAASRIMHALFRKLPGVEDEIARGSRGNQARNPPTPWILFAPATNFSALTRHLKRDYDRLEAMLQEAPDEVGGLGLLEDRLSRTRNRDNVEIAPFVPLNEAQRLAVKQILNGDPLTVVSGPPGTGKSQVVVAVLLNAWAQGKTVLFASNNNKAVDVIRERLERFESEFPIAVRAGSLQKQNIMEVLRRTLNMANASAHKGAPSISEKALDKRRELAEERQRLVETLDTGGPQRIEEAKRAALQSYAEYQQHLAQFESQSTELSKRQQALKLGGMSPETMELRVNVTQEWLGRIEAFKQMVTHDVRQRVEVASSIAALTKERLALAATVGLDAERAGDWSWIGGGVDANALADWEGRFRVHVMSAVDQMLDQGRWNSLYDRWRSDTDAELCASRARKLGEGVRRCVAESLPKLEELRELGDRVAQSRTQLREMEIPADVQLDVSGLRAWLAAYVELSTSSAKAMNWLPWSRKSILEKELRSLESGLRAGFPLAIWARVGQLNENGRAQLAPCIETSLNWIGLRGKWHEAQQLAKEILETFQGLRSELAALQYVAIPTAMDMKDWVGASVACVDLASEAAEAHVAWKRRTQADDARQTLQTLAREGQRLGAGVPLRLAWSSGIGSAFESALQQLVQEPGPGSLALARAAVHSGTWSKFVQCLHDVSQLTSSVTDLKRESRMLPDVADRIGEWWLERPPGALVLEKIEGQDWPSLDEPQAYLRDVLDLRAAHREFLAKIAPELRAEASSAKARASEKLRLAFEVAPRTAGWDALRSLADQIKTEDSVAWPIADISTAFLAFGPDRLKARIERLTADLERNAFDDAKQRWLQRLQDDDAVIRAVDALERSLRQHKGQVVEPMYGAFRKTLEAVPIWITTAQAAQAIPLEAKLFDLVIIDEASQCTLTNLLPLVYRAHSLAVIGDEHQLPAIPSIQPVEELSLASKYEVEEFLGWVGHANVNVYGVAVESLPRRRADVLTLKEHFRSHPQIIGFSNRHIYQQRLELKKDPQWDQRMPVGSGVHSVPVQGTAERGERGRSWVNPIEGERVLKLIGELRSDQSRHLSIGVVTPFAAQKEWLRKRIEPLGLASEILIDSAYGFQGDERDVIIFSTVVARGITSSACKWVESPPNLVNVAMTRAREALFVVSDFDHCLQQEGILRKLAQYCRDIQVLRETSVAELELFSWMTVKGWVPRIHPRIGDIEVDFVLESEGRDRIAIEVDGREHHQGTPEQDRARDAFLSAQGFQVLRILARDVLQTPFDVIQRIGTMVEGSS